MNLIRLIIGTTLSLPFSNSMIWCNRRPHTFVGQLVHKINLAKGIFMFSMVSNKHWGDVYEVLKFL